MHKQEEEKAGTGFDANGNDKDNDDILMDKRLPPTAERKVDTSAIYNIAEVSVAVAVEEVEFSGTKMHKIALQPKDIRVPLKTPQPTSTPELSQHFWQKHSGREVLYAKANVPSHPELQEARYSHGLITALLYAYNYHADVVLSPDDFWLTVAHGLANHILQNAEKLRPLFVAHEGQKELVITGAGSIATADWERILSDLQTALAAHVKAQFVENILCDFSTSQQVERYASIVSAICGMQKFFHYTVRGCGLRNLYFMGTLADWQRLRVKVEKLAMYGLEEWIQHLLFILDHWIDTFQGKLNLEFWNKMVNKIEGIKGSGRRTFVLSDFTGWIVYLAQARRKVQTGNFPKVVFEAPFEYLEASGKVTPLTFYAGFSGLSYQHEAFRPQLSYAVVLGHSPPVPDRTPRKYVST